MFYLLRLDKDILLCSAVTSNSPYLLVLHITRQKFSFCPNMAKLIRSISKIDIGAGHVCFTFRTSVTSLSADLYIGFDSNLKKIKLFCYIIAAPFQHCLQSISFKMYS